MNNGQTVTLGDGAAHLALPDSWRIRETERDRVKVTFPFGDYPVLGINVVSVEDPDAVASGKPGAYLDGGDAGLVVAGDSESGWALSYRAVLDGDEEVRIWRRAAVFGARHIRIVTLALAHPATDEARDTVDREVAGIEAAAESVQFGAAETPLDREASAKRRADALVWRRATPWDGVAINLPADWTEHPAEGARELALEVPGLEGTYFILEGDTRTLRKRPLDAEATAQLIRTVAESKQASDIVIRSGGDGEYLLSCSRMSEPPAAPVPVQERFWHRFLFASGQLVVLNATFVFPADTDQPELHAALARVLAAAMTEAEVAVSDPA